MNKCLKTFFISILLLGGALAHAQETSIKSEENIDKPLNEKVAQYNQEPQRMVFDIYFSDEFVGNALGLFTNEWIELDTPSDIIDQIPNLKTPSALIPLLTGRLPAGETKTIEEVGYIIAKPNYFKIDITAAPEQLIIKRLEDRDIILPERTLSLSHNMNINASTDFDPSTFENSSLTHSSKISKGAWRFGFSGIAAKGTGYEYGGWGIEHDVGSTTYKAGMLSTPGARFSSGQAIWGFEAQTNTRLLSRQNIIQSSPIELYIPSRARVRVLRKGEQQIFNEVLNFGLQEINTNSFPDGSYDVTIRIEEDDGTVIEEVRQFSKNSDLEIGSGANYSFQAGMLRSGFKLENAFAAQGALSWKWNEIISLRTTLMLTEDLAVLGQSLQGKKDEFTYNFDTQVTSTGALAAAATFRYNRRPWAALLIAEKTFAGHKEAALAANNERLLSSNSEIISASGSYSFGKWSIQGNASRSKTTGTKEARYSYGPRLSWNMFSSREHSLRSVFSYKRTNNGVNSSAFAFYSYRPYEKSWESTSQIGRKRASTRDSMVYRTALAYNKNLGGSRAFRAIAAQQEELGNEKYHNTNTQIAYSGENYRWEVSGRHNESTVQSGEEEMDFKLETNILMAENKRTKEKDFFVEPKASGSSSFVATVAGNAPDAEFRVLVNGRPRGRIKTGETLNIGLTPYKSYRITLAPAGDTSLVSFDNTPYDVTLYPGNIAHHKWNVHKSVLILGRLIDIEGDAITWQTVKGMQGSTATDGSGNFQLEMTGNESPYIKSSSTKCTFAIPDLTTDEYFKYVGDILCL